MASMHKVRIAARLRPRINGEIDDESVKVCRAAELDGNTSNNGEASSSSLSATAATGSFISVTNPRDPSQIFKFPFTSCYDQSSTQAEIFEADVKPMVDVVYSGVTVTIFAYGVTSSGKTHTMQGTRSDPGIIPRVVETLFAHSHLPTYAHLKIGLQVSYMEIYKDDVYDLLVERETAPKLPVRENGTGEVFVANLATQDIESLGEFEELYARASKRRSTGSTNLNHASSRSHAVLTIYVTLEDVAGSRKLTGKMNLVDLAGSENNKLTGNDASRMAESAAINKSLSVLGQVVHALNTNQTRIPYRNSKLTRILQDALGGSSVGLLICNIAPGVKFRQDTLNTLNFAVRTKNIENKPVVNERDTRPAPKPHFAAVTTRPAAGTVLQPLPSAAGSNGVEKGRVGRPSLMPKPRYSRLSELGGMGMGKISGMPGGVLGGMGGGRGSNAYQPFGMKENYVREGNESVASDRSGSLGLGLSEKEIDERINKAVEMEVARRLEERAKEDEERRARERESYSAAPSGSWSGRERHKSRSPKKEVSLPSGVLTPLLKRHKDLDDELKARLKELERKYDHDDKEAQLAGVLSPISKKKTGRAYVALARAHSEKGDLQVALDLYRKAASHVPDNIKLKERIIDIEWALKNDKPFVPSPKREKKVKGKGKKGKKPTVGDAEMFEVMNQNPMSDDQGDADEVAMALGQGPLDLGLEGITAETPSHAKRYRALYDDEEVDEEVSAPKKQKRGVV